jgi:hypothetical protein
MMRSLAIVPAGLLLLLLASCTTSAPTPELSVPPTRHNIELHPMMMENTKISVGEHIGIPLGSYNVQLTQELDGNFVLCLGTNGNCGDILWQSGYHGSESFLCLYQLIRFQVLNFPL